jgi:hypothetical protein
MTVAAQLLPVVFLEGLAVATLEDLLVELELLSCSSAHSLYHLLLRSLKVLQGGRLSQITVGVCVSEFALS